jgi:murein DD-endopeptidase MepM/ murein hydrolase activator NlpD
MRRHQPFIIPLEGPITQGFGPSDLSFEPTVNYRGTYYPRFHTGIDISAPENTPVHAAADGVVVLAASSRDSKGHYTGYGNYVVIAHPDGFTTLYGHLNSFSVREGDVVHQGQIIGQEGSTGMSTGPHVHFEIRHNGEWVDPMPYLTGKAST